MCISNDFNRSMFDKTKYKNKKYFCKNYLQCFSSKNVLREHEEVCLSINGAQVQLGLKIISNKYQFYLKFVLILSVNKKVLKVMKVLTQRNIKITFLVVLLTNLFVLMINLLSQ